MAEQENLAMVRKAIEGFNAGRPGDFITLL